ncbi:MAG: selenium-dependent xanthine dehydrogenase, partial [Firmicutes bacterium]|nr:selenium-dependent xanthine dehydrogenase [Bacillota bacterium]
AEFLREGAEPPDSGGATGRVGESLPRPDAAAKVLGAAEYTDDLSLPGMLYGGAVRSAYPRARIIKINIEKALSAKGVAAVVRAEDIPGQRKIGHLKQDWDALIPEGGITRYVGDAIVLIAAKTRRQLEAAKALVEIEYEPLPPLASPEESLASGAPAIHEGGNLLSREHLARGDADAAIAGAKHAVTRHYSTPFTEHAFLEPETAVALPEGDGIRIYAGDQGVYQTRKECSRLLGLPEQKVRVTAKTVGGGFGGKEDMSVQHHAALLAYLLRKPVKVSLSRRESMLVHPKRHPMEIDVTTACDENGILVAMKAVIISDTGAYASLGGPVLQRACTHAAGPYHYHNIDILGMAVYTNNPPAGAFRGFGVPQSCFATECNLNLLAEMVGISPFEIRYRNAIRPGQALPNGQIADASTALVETLDAVRPMLDKHPKAGIACAMKNAGLGVGVPDTGRCRLTVRDGKVRLWTSAACIGQGVGSAVTQIVCEAAGLSAADVIHEPADTQTTPNAGNTTASRQTVFTGEAARRAALELRAALRGKTLAALEGQAFHGEFSYETDPLGSEKPHPVSHISYSYATHVAVLKEDGRIEKFIAAHDVGRAINPRAVEGQVEGGVVMSLGYALTEDYPVKGCVPHAKFGTLGLLRATDTPPIETIIIEKNNSPLACGAKGIGEIASIPTAPAVQLAYYLRDGHFRTRLPLEGTPYSRRP